MHILVVTVVLMTLVSHENCVCFHCIKSTIVLHKFCILPARHYCCSIILSYSYQLGVNELWQ